MVCPCLSRRPTTEYIIRYVPYDVLIIISYTISSGPQLKRSCRRKLEMINDCTVYGST